MQYPNSGRAKRRAQTKTDRDIDRNLFFLLLFSHDSGSFIIEPDGQSAAPETILCGPRALPEI